MVNTYEGLLALLTQNKIRFMLVGGLAVSLEGLILLKRDSMRKKDLIDVISLQRIEQTDLKSLSLNSLRQTQSPNG